MSQEKSFKETLNLPKTEFPLRAGLKKREPEIEESLQKANIYQKLLEKNRQNQKFVLHDGPPYPNGDIHLGHALNKTLKDIVLKYKAMRGFYVPYIPGWDCHGLPIETQLLKELKKGKQPVPETAAFREKCKEYALGYVEKQKEQFKRLGIIGDWSNPYLTLTPAYEAEVLSTFKNLALGGYIYKGSKPIHWCPECKQPSLKQKLNIRSISHLLFMLNL